MIIDYDELAAQFEDSLLHTLRGHHAALDLLETWVPDDDPVRGLLNMVEAAQLAGQTSIEIRISLETLPPARHPELSQVLADLGAVSLQCEQEALLVRVGSSDHEEDFDAAGADLAAGLRKLFAEMTHEGPLPAPAADLAAALAEEDGVALSLLVDHVMPHNIRKARHSGGRNGVERAAIEAICIAAEGAPLLDAADHAAIRALHALRDGAAARPGAGNLQPGYEKACLALGARLLRKARAGFLKAGGGKAGWYNDHDAPPDRAWLEAPPQARLDRLDGQIALFLAEAGLATADITIEAIENDLHGLPVRVMVSFGEGVEPERKPGLMRRLEARLKGTVEPTLQLYHEPQKDQNRIRRL